MSVKDNNRFKELGAALKGKELPEETTTLLPTSEVDLEAPSSKQRKKGKRSNPDYEQVGVYIQRKLHLEVKKRLLTNSERDFSDLVNELITNWLDE
jgi:hypothetical protein